MNETKTHAVQAAVAEYMERIDRGEAVDRQQFLAQHADIAAELESFIATAEQLGEMAGLKPVQATLPPPPEASTRSIAAQGEETLIPKRVAADAKATLIQGLPERFGRYRVLKPLGSGAMGTVYLAEDTQLERKVALKTPSFDEDETGELLQRFYREAKAAATLRNPHICPVYDVGEIDGKHYISMAYIAGRPLSAYIQPDKPQAERQILIIIRKLALALDEAHRHGIIHRDLKPGNVMIDEKGEPIVMDFGLARRTQREEASRLTQSGMIVGSPAYMSPEQVEGDQEKVGPAADQYSLGVILYELLTGQLPFRGGVTAVIGAILTKDPTPVAELRKGVDPRVAALCARMMAKKSPDRYPSLKAVADEVTALLKDAGAATGKEAARESVKASRVAESPAKPPAPQAAKVEKGAGTAAAVSITASNVTSLFEAAQKCLRKHDYEQVVQMLQQIPEQKRTDEVRALLAKARQLADEVAFLLAEIDEAERVNDNAVLTRATDELLKLKPKHHKALQLKEELSRYGKGKLWKPGGYTPDGRRIGEGSWVPWIGIAVGVIAFALALWSVTIYLKKGDAVVRVQITNPDVKVSFQGRTLNIQSANKEFDVEPGENTLTITYNDATFETDKFTLQDGENPAVVVELLDKTLAAKFGEESIGEWPVEPQLAGATGASATTGTNAAATGAETVYELRTHTCRPGGFDALIARYRDHHEPLFQKLGITSIAYWTPIEEPQASNTLLVLFRHESREAATRSWQAFQNDRQLPAAEIGRVGDQRVKSVFLKLTESSPLPGPVSSGKAYELRAATASAESVPAPNDASRQEMGARLLARHGIKAYASFAATDDTQSDSNRYRILEYQDEGSYKSARQAFVDDPEYKAMRAEREGAGNLAAPATSMFLRSADHLIRPPATPAGSISSGRYDVLFNKDQGWLYTYRVDADRFTRETVDILGSGKGPQPLTEGRGTIEKLAGGTFRLTYDPATWNGKPPAEVWTAKGSDGSYTTEYWFPAENYAAQKPPNLTGVVTLRADPALNSSSPPQLVPLTELNTGNWDAYAWISLDGLRIYWEAPPATPGGQRQIWQAERPDPGSQFGNKLALIEGRQPTLTPDEKQLVFVEAGGTKRLFTASRSSMTAAFGPSRELTQFAPYGTFNSPSISADGLTLFVNGKPAGQDAASAYVPLVSRRPSVDADWGPASPLQFAWDLAQQGVPPTWFSLAPDELSCLATHEGQGRGKVVRFTRAATGGPFANFEYVSLPGIGQVYGKAPRYVPATRELFVTIEASHAANVARAQLAAGDNGDLYVIRNVDLGPNASPASTAGSGWTDLFNGRDLTGWRKTGVESGWSVQNGEIAADVGTQGGNAGWLMTEKDYSDFELQLEFAVSALTDSGVAFRCDPKQTGPSAIGQAEIQIVDEQDPAKLSQLEQLTAARTGALASLSAARTVPNLERGEWHSMNVHLQGRKLRVTVDGVVTTDTDLNQHVEQARKGQGRPGVWRASGPIGLQKFMGNVRFRNIRIRDLSAGSAAAGAAAEDSTELFNGRDLTGWTLHKSEGQQPPITWTADLERQVLVANSGGQNWLETDKTYRDFVLSLEWRFPPGKFVGPNGSGIVVRAEGLNVINYDPKGVEIDLLRSTSADKTRGPGDFVTYDTRIVHSTGATPERGNGMKGTITEPQISAVTNWNTCEITCQGDRISVQMNGVLVNEATGVPQRAGKICLRSQNADVEFRNIRIHELNATAAAAGSPAGTPQAAPLFELNTAEHESVPWVSTNGLRIYWEGPPPTGQEGQWIWTADRPLRGTTFENKRALLAGHHPVLTGVELEVIFTRRLGTGRFEMHSASRQSTGDPFGAPIRLPQFDGMVPWLSADGLRLYVTHTPGNASTQYLISRRPNRTANWGPTEPVDIRWDQAQRGPLGWISLSGDELSLLATHGGDAGQRRIVRSSRSSVTDPFRDWDYVSLPGIGQVHGATPRYCPLTRELFLWAPPDYAQASQADAWKGPSDVWVIRNVDLPWSGGR